MWKLSVAFAFALGASCYSSGRYDAWGTGRFVGIYGKSGCIEVALALTEDESAPPPIVAYTFGNACYHQTVLDLTAPRVVAFIGDDHKRVELHRDDAGIVKPMQIDALGYGQERIAYREGTTQVGDVRLVCVDIGRLDAHADAHEDWKCLGGFSPTWRP